ncbi:MAG: 4-(cytidine 5'-diphospho)-2-C-methyl-D-erythritol kinase [Pseudomonadota bacterium]
MRTSVIEVAPAKINLALHVLGQRADGYHNLQSLVTFTDIADEIRVEAADDSKASVSGPFGHGLDMDASNLVCRAARGWQAACGGQHPDVHLHLTKNLPLASGIGGGSADAAATLRALGRLFDAALPAHSLEAIALSLGADVPMCLSNSPALVEGVGEKLSPVALPSFPIVLINPGVGIATPTVFAALAHKNNPPLSALPHMEGSHQVGDAGVWLDWMKAQRNDLEAPAIGLVPPIADGLSAMGAQAGCRLSRMSGSGATCFGLFEDDAHAAKAAKALAQALPDWWVQVGRTMCDENRKL